MSSEINNKLIQVIQSLQNSPQDFILITIVNQHFERQFGKWSNGTLTKYFETENVFEFKKIGPGKHLVRVALDSNQASNNSQYENPVVNESNIDNVINQKTESENIENQYSKNSSESKIENIQNTTHNTQNLQNHINQENSQKTHHSTSAAPRNISSNTQNNSNMYSVDHEIQTMLNIIREMIPDGNLITYGEIFKSDKIQNSIESLSGTLKAAKRRNILHYKPELLMQGFSDKEIITIQSWTI